VDSVRSAVKPVSLPAYYRAIGLLGVYICALSARGGADEPGVCDNIILVLKELRHRDCFSLYIGHLPQE